MPDIFASEVQTNDFALPGDEELLGRPSDEATTQSETPEETPAEETPSPERDEQGRFKAREEETPPPGPDPEDAAPEAPTGGETDDELQAYLAKYGGDQEKALRAAVEAQKLIGKQGTELKELRDSLEQRFDEFEERITPPAPTYDLQTVADRLVERPDLIPQVAQAAFAEGNREILKIAMVAWNENDPYAAEDFRLDMAAATARREIERIDQQADQIHTTNSEALDEFIDSHPDFHQYATEMSKLSNNYKYFNQILQTGDKEARLEVLDFLYTKAQSLKRDTSAAQAREAEAATAADTDRAIEEAAVTSGTTTHSEQKLTPAEEMGRIWESRREPYDQGWNV